MYRSGHFYERVCLSRYLPIPTIRIELAIKTISSTELFFCYGIKRKTFSPHYYLSYKYHMVVVSRAISPGIETINKASTYQKITLIEVVDTWCLNKDLAIVVGWWSGGMSNYCCRMVG
ncbi:hypothetical protein VCUG_00183 [Vavraia culicis subsp. floridensis]|uniref:Uncharacterized protein n=1 Tax=Vavraia culicis (isolate floridensis) TaxID=948595 RepID=L2GYC7_VAVCU|nr:uncharacterized protein VCUG_00183 [Vavraia culicis subsp. floridensis]ELA48347.1 hypothetical protein VCUG_00183 [Vavraia culicis subsp. floridensis]